MHLSSYERKKKHSLLINLSKFFKIMRHAPCAMCFFGIIRILRSEPNYVIEHPHIIPDIYVELGSSLLNKVGFIREFSYRHWQFMNKLVTNTEFVH